MEEQLIGILNELKNIKAYIVKLPIIRRQGDNFDGKIKQAKIIYSKYEEISLLIKSDACNNELILLCKSIKDSYIKILSFVSKSDSKMTEPEKFCLKTAVSLLPKMNGNEQVTQELIDSIELYESMLGDGDHKLLINFVLKTRLNEGAKMRLNNSYNTVQELLTDMRNHLLTIKSDTALQTKLQQARQGNKSIQQFGCEIERMFVDLTITQAKGDSNAYNVLRPLNEKNAIKRFSDGLQSQRLGTIISARNFSSLKDAVRAAEDESLGSINPVISYSSNQRYTPRGRGFANRNNYSRNANYANNRNNFNNNYFNTSRSVYGGASNSRGVTMQQRGQQFRNSSRGRGFRSQQRGHRTVNYVDATTSDDQRNLQNDVEFFRD